MANKVKSRTARWGDAVAAAETALDAVREAAEGLASALVDLRDVQEEYESWRDNLPENLQQSALGEKLEAICDLDLDHDDPLNDWATVEEVIGEASGVELPLGFGRD